MRFSPKTWGYRWDLGLQKTMRDEIGMRFEIAKKICVMRLRWDTPSKNEIQWDLRLVFCFCTWPGIWRESQSHWDSNKGGPMRFEIAVKICAMRLRWDTPLKKWDTMRFEITIASGGAQWDWDIALEAEWDLAPPLSPDLPEAKIEYEI